MKSFKKWLALFLAGALLAASFAACAIDVEMDDDDDDEEQSEKDKKPSVTDDDGDDDEDDDNDSDDDDDSTVLFPDYSGLTEKERTINIAYVEGGNFTLTEHSLVPDEEVINPNDQVDLAVQYRNQMVESELGVKLNAIKVSEDNAALAAAVEQSIMAGYGDYDILAGYQYYSVGLANKHGGLLLNLADLDRYDADYIDFDASYWAKDYNDTMSYKDAYYWITGDLALRYLGGMYCTFVNSDTYTDKLEAAYGNIYDIAKEGRWTLDLMMQMSELCHTDYGMYGFGYELVDMIDAMALGAGVTFSTKDSVTGEISLTIGNYATKDFAQKLYMLLNADTSYEFAAFDSENVMASFAYGNVAFTINKLYMSQFYLEEFNDFYVIPVPKYDESQPNYITPIHDGVTVFAIPEDCGKLPQTAAALELMAAYSAQYVRPAYYDAALKNRYVRDAEASEMIDLIHATVQADFAMVWSSELQNIAQVFRTKQNSWDRIIRNESTWADKLAELTMALDNARY